MHLREVADEPMVLFDLPPASDHLMTVCRAAGVSPSVAHRTATVELTRSLVGAGLGYTVLAQRAPGTRTAAGDRVVEIDLADDPAPLGIVLARSRTVQPSATARGKRVRSNDQRRPVADGAGPDPRRRTARNPVSHGSSHERHRSRNHGARLDLA